MRVWAPPSRIRTYVRATGARTPVLVVSGSAEGTRASSQEIGYIWLRPGAELGVLGREGAKVCERVNDIVKRETQNVKTPGRT